jgi:hypothetical protein
MSLRPNLKVIFDCEPVTIPAKRAQDNTPGQPRPPKCPNCGIDTLWYQSRLHRQNGSSKIIHSFHCPNCAMVVTTEEPTKQGLRVV